MNTGSSFGVSTALLERLPEAICEDEEGMRKRKGKGNLINFDFNPMPRL